MVEPSGIALVGVSASPFVSFLSFAPMHICIVSALHVCVALPVHICIVSASRVYCVASICLHCFRPSRLYCAASVCLHCFRPSCVLCCQCISASFPPLLCIVLPVHICIVSAPHVCIALQRFFACAVGKNKQAARTDLGKLDMKKITCREAVKEIAKMYAHSPRTFHAHCALPSAPLCNLCLDVSFHDFGATALPNMCVSQRLQVA